MSPPRSDTGLSALAALLSTETAALRRMDFASTAAIYREKKRLVDAVGRKPNMSSGQSREEIDELLRAVRDNTAALRRAIHVQRNILGIVAAATRNASPSTSYGRKGTSRSASHGLMFHAIG